MLSADDLLAFRSVSDTRISPDGRRVAFVVTDAIAAAGDEPPGSRVWLVDAEGGAPRQLTQGPHRDHSLAWSPDGRSLDFLSDRAERGTSRLYLLPADGGEARALDTPRGSVKRFAWSPDGGRIAFVRTDRRGDDRGGTTVRQDADQPGVQTEGYDPQEPARDDRKDGDKKAPVVVEEEPRFDRVWTVDVAGGAVSRATDAAAQVWELAWLPDGRALAVVVADEPTASAWYSCRLARLDLGRGDITTLHRPPPGRQIARPAPSPSASTRVGAPFFACALPIMRARAHPDAASG